MRTYVLRRLLQVIPLLLGVSALAFLLLHLAPGDATYAIADEGLSAEALRRLRHAYGLDVPLWRQYLTYLGNVVLHGDFGRSVTSQVPVAQLLRERLWNTLLLTGAGACVTWGLAIPLGVLAARRQHTWVDRTLSLGAFAALSLPEMISGLLLVYLAARTHWFPIDGMHSLDAAGAGPLAGAFDVAHHLVLPALVLGLVPLASRMRQMRGHLLDVLRLDYVVTARAKGLSEGAVVRRHALSGAFVVEFIFNWPGLGTMTIEAIRAQDQNLVLGAVLMGATVLVLGNLVADILLAIADPRIAHD